MIFFQEEMLYVAQKLINLKETKDDGKAGADLQYTNQLINCISLDPKYIQNGWDLNMRLRMEYPEIDDIQNIINIMYNIVMNIVLYFTIKLKAYNL